MRAVDLPRVDEHATVIAAGAEDIWVALSETMDRAFSTGRAATIARALRCANCGAWGPRPLAEGSAVPGFRVTQAVPLRELHLTGRHRFSAYALIFRLDHLDDGTTRLRAETRAAFPGVAGAAYRLLVIGTRGHVLVVRRLLAATRRRAERTPRSA